MSNILEVDGVQLEFGQKRILQDVYLKSETGKVTGLLGRNGTGKSCLMKIIFGELNAHEKSVRINGQPMLGSKRSQRDLRYLPQGDFIPKHLKIKDVISDFKIDFDDLYYTFPEFKNLYYSKLSKLSGGERRIFEIFTILVAKSSFCMLDEPFSQVMPIHIEKIKNLIQREKQNKGIILTDHMFQHIIQISDQIYLLNNGKTHLIKSIDEIEHLGYARIS